jgi:transcriptional regulator with XRE-family HTH domain
MSEHKRRRPNTRRRKPAIRPLLRWLRVSLSELSRRTGIDRTQLRQVISGKVVPSWYTLTRIADALGVTVGAFDQPTRKVVVHA